MIKLSRSKLTIVILIVMALILLILFDFLGLMKPLKSLITTILKPIESPLVALGAKIDNLFQYFKSKNKLEKENQLWQEEIEKLLVENNQLKNKIEEIKALEKEWEFARKYNYIYVSGKVIGKSPDNLQILIFNKGEKDGIKNDLPVIAGEGILVGKVIKTQATISKILLLTDNHSRVAAVIQNNEKIEGVVKGEHGLSLKMELIPQDKKIQPKAHVVTSGLEGYIPPSLVIGQVDKIFQKPGDLFQEVSITPSTSYDNLQILTVIVS